MNITSHGRLHLGAALGSHEFVDQHIADKVCHWQEELTSLAEVAKSQPHTAYTAFTHGFVHKFSFLSRTIPNISPLLQPLEDRIRHRLIPALTGRPPPNDSEHELLALPVRLGGLGIVNPTLLPNNEYQASVEVSAPLKDLILNQEAECPFQCLDAQILAKRATHKQNRKCAKSSATTLRATISAPLQRAMDLAQEKGASSCLTSLPLEEFGFSLHKGAFRDAILLRYGWLPQHTPTTCTTNFSVEHALSCPKGGFPTIRHNEVRDLTANLISEVCNNVSIEPTLQPITGEALSGASAITEDGARLDVAANGFWGGPFECAFFDVRVFNPHAPSNRQYLNTCYRKHENIKKGPTSRGSGKLNTAHSRHSSCPSLVALATPLPCVTRGWPPSSAPSGINLTAARWPGSGAGWLSHYFAQLSNASVAPDLQEGTPAENSTPWTSSRPRHNMPRLT